MMMMEGGGGVGEGILFAESLMEIKRCVGWVVWECATAAEAICVWGPVMECLRVLGCRAVLARATGVEVGAPMGSLCMALVTLWG